MRVERRRDHGGLGPKSKREKETERDPITQGPDYDRGPMVARGTRPNKHREREQKTTQMVTTTNMYSRM